MQLVNKFDFCGQYVLCPASLPTLHSFLQLHSPQPQTKQHRYGHRHTEKRYASLIVDYRRNFRVLVFWSPSLTAYRILPSLEFYTMAGPEKRGGHSGKQTAQSSRRICSWASQWSFTLFSNTVAHSLSMRNPTMTTFTTFSATP